MRRAASVASIVLLLVPLALIALPAGHAHHEAPQPVTEISELQGPTHVTWRSLAWAPDGSHALLVGKLEAGDTSRDIIARWTAEDGLEEVYNRSGSGLVDVTFHESGTSLVVGLQGTLLLGEPGAYRNVWNETSYHEDGLDFFGLRGAFRPTGDWALVSGSSLLKVHLDGDIEVVHGGRDAFFRSMDWNPATGLTEPFAWVEAAIDREGQALLGVVYRTNGTTPDQEDNVAIYGRANPGKALLNTVAFAPNGSFGLLAGRDGVGASILSWSSHREPAHEHPDREAPHDHRWQYLPAAKSTGAITCLDWHPENGYALAVGLEDDVVGYVGPHIYAPVLHRGPDLFACGFHPDGQMALAAGANGTLLRIEPGPQPLAAVVQPAPGQLVAPQENATFVLGTMPRMSSDQIEVTGHVAGTDITAETTQQGTWWQLSVNASQLEDGHHALRIEVHGTRGSSTFSHPFLVNNEAFTPPAPRMLAPTGLEGSGADSDGLFTLHWEPLDAPVVYEVQETSAEQGVNASRTLQAGSQANLTVRVEDSGSYLYKVRAKNAFNTGAWSNSRVVNVVLDSDGDGVPDSKDPRPYVADTWGDQDGDGFDADVEYKQCSDPADANSTPSTDDDGDGIRNAVECLQGTDPRDPLDPPPEETGPDDQANGTDSPSDEDGGNGTPAPGALVSLVTVALVSWLARRRRR